MEKGITDAQIDALRGKAIAAFNTGHADSIIISIVDFEALVLRMRKAEAKPELAADERERFNLLHYLLEETFQFANTSPKAQENINAVLDIIDEIQAAKADAAEQITKLENALEIEDNYSSNLVLQLKYAKAQVERAVRLTLSCLCGEESYRFENNDKVAEILSELAKQNNKESQ